MINNVERLVERRHYLWIKIKRIKDENEKQIIRNEIDNITQERKLNNNKIKVLIVSHPYNIYDKYMSSSIIKYLNENDIQII